MESEGLSEEVKAGLEKLNEALSETSCLDKMLVLGLATGALFHHLLEDHLPDDYTYAQGYLELLKEFTREIEAARAHCQREDGATAPVGEDPPRMGGPAIHYVSPKAKGFH